MDETPEASIVTSVLINTQFTFMIVDYDIYQCLYAKQTSDVKEAKKAIKRNVCLRVNAFNTIYCMQYKGFLLSLSKFDLSAAVLYIMNVHVG